MLAMDFQCPYCKREYSREKDALGKTARCKCGKSFVIHEKTVDAEEFEGEEGVEYEVFKEDILKIEVENSSDDDLISDFPERITFVGGKQKKEVLDCLLF